MATCGGTGTLIVDGTVADERKMEQTIPVILQFDESLDVGSDTLTGVTENLIRFDCVSDPWRPPPSIRSNLVFGSDRGARGYRAGGFFCPRIMREFCLRARLSSGWSRTSHNRLIVVFG